MADAQKREALEHLRSAIRDATAALESAGSDTDLRTIAELALALAATVGNGLEVSIAETNDARCTVLSLMGSITLAMDLDDVRRACVQYLHNIGCPDEMPTMSALRDTLHKKGVKSLDDVPLREEGTLS